MSQPKPFDIDKRLFVEAFEKVRANRGAAGVDGVTVAVFEERLKDNLYKTWNRMSSGTYFPPPLREVVIPKPEGGQRTLAVPTWLTGSPRRRPCWCWARGRSRGSTPTRSGTGRAGRRWTRSRWPGNGRGNTPG